MSRPRRALPLSAWAAIAATGAGLLVLGAVAIGLAAAGRLDRSAVVAGLGLGALAILVAAVLVGVIGDRAATALRALRSEAVRRLEHPSIAVHRGAAGTMLGVRSTVEVRELARVLDALHLRVRVADDVAARHRRTAETASAGMFELLSGLVASEEGARGQLAAELHDTVAQSLAQARRLMADPEQSDRAGDFVVDAEEQVRAVMARTRPPALREGDLASAVGQLRDDLAFRYGFHVVLDWPESPRPLPLVTAITVYRFFQEALLNVVKHADVEEAVARLVFEEDGVLAVVTDEGPGFDPALVRPEKGRHVGLGLLKERARLAGGSVTVTSAPGAGTTLALRLPQARLGTAAAPLPAIGTVVPAERLALDDDPSALAAAGEGHDTGQ